MRTCPKLFTICFVLLSPTTVFAWDYLEHAWFSDRACIEAQRMLSPGLTTDEQRARYVAMSLFCPQKWEPSYCADELKTVRGSITDVDPADGYSMTLGDYSALGDHVTHFGPLPGIERAQEDGLVLRTYEWLTEGGTTGGIEEDVAEDACETEVADFANADAGVSRQFKRIRDEDGYAQIPSNLLKPGIRANPIKGPADPSARYSFNNPRYLDMVLRNHAHFGDDAFASWLGFHSAALQVAERDCTDIVPINPDMLEDLADNLEAWEDVDWEELKGASRAKKACQMLTYSTWRRVQDWMKSADPQHTRALKSWVDNATDAQQQMVFSAVVSMVLEGVALHFLQDGLASGHMRTIRSREALADVRYDHDSDNAHGVVATISTREGLHWFFAFGDTYLLGAAQRPGCLLSWETLSTAGHIIPEVLTECTLEHQRGVLTASTSASLADFVLGGIAFEPVESCGSIHTNEGWICRNLPTQASVASGHAIAHSEAPLTYATLPVPHPRYSYESLSFRTGLEIESSSPQIGLVLSFFDELGTEGHWMRNWRFGLTATFGDDEDNQWILDAAYAFHYRLSARFMLDLGPFWYVGLRDLNEDVEVVAGIGPLIGITALPEGWMRIPLELNITYQVPLTFFASKDGFFSANVVEDHWLQFGIGLAFSH